MGSTPTTTTKVCYTTSHTPKDDIVFKYFNTPWFRAVFIVVFSAIAFHWWGYANYPYVYDNRMDVKTIVVDRVDAMTSGKRPRQRFILILDVVDPSVPNVRTSLDVSPETWYSAKPGDNYTFTLRYDQLYPRDDFTTLVFFGIVITGSVIIVTCLYGMLIGFYFLITYKTEKTS